MHGYSPEFLLLVNAEVDSMGGVIDGGVGVDSKISPRSAAIEKAAAELRLEYDVREERRRELEFLVKGGNPLDFKLGPATSISVQSTSVADQFVNSEAKGSFALTASPRGDSVESSGRPGAVLPRETNTADNLLLFDGENDAVEGERKFTHHSRSKGPALEQVSKLDGFHTVKESEESGMLRYVVTNQAYARRNRSSTNRSSVGRSRHGARDSKGLVCEATLEKGRTTKSTSNSKSTKVNGNVVGKTTSSDNQLHRESDTRLTHETASGPTRMGEADSEVRPLKKLKVAEHRQLPHAGADEVHKDTTPVEIDSIAAKEGVLSDLSCMPSAAPTKMPIVNIDTNVNRVDMPEEGGNSSTPIDKKLSVDPESSYMQIDVSLDENSLSDHHLNMRTTKAPENLIIETTLLETSKDLAAVKLVKEESATKADEVPAEDSDHQTAVCLNSKDSVSCVKFEEEGGDSGSGMENELKSFSNHEREVLNGHIVSDTEVMHSESVVDDSNEKLTSICSQDKPLNTTVPPHGEPQNLCLPGRGLIEASDRQTCDEEQLKLAKKVHEDSILEEARSVEAKRKRIAELSVRGYPSEYRRKSHWDFVLEEMAWLANDFMQERLWKTTAAAQISHKAALKGQLRIDKQNLCSELKQIAHTLTKAIIQFWHSAEELLGNDSSVVLENSKLDLIGSEKVDEKLAIKNRIRDTDMDMSGRLEEQNTAKKQLPVQGYAVRFLKYSNMHNFPIQAEAPKTPERLSDTGAVDLLSKDQFTEETLFYTVAPGAMEEYRKSLENYWSQYEKVGGSVHLEEVDTSIFGAGEEFGTRENIYEEDDAGAYYLPGGFEGSKSSKSAMKKKKSMPKSYARAYDMGSDLPYGHFTENKSGTNPLFLGKRPNDLNVGSIPIKRVRTASRRVVYTGATGGVQMPIKADVSSGDTSSYQDDQSTANGGSNMRKSMEVESTGEYGKQLPFDCTEVSMKHKKKKKAKHLAFKNSLTENGAFVIGKGPAYEQRWQLDSMVQNEQRDYSKKRLESHGFESNGVFGQHATKRPKLLKQLQDSSESNTPLNGIVPSPVASQMSNMSNPNKLMKLIAGRDRGRKAKALKTPAGQTGAGSLWSLFEDQALVVLVHDMGPNWELVSDAISSTLQFKCIFRNPKECKERHKVLMDRTAGDGADSAEDSGSSQPYPSTLPGIPKGSARQLFQRLQGPMEEDTLKSHFEKIIMIGQKQHSRRIQSDSQGLKIMPVHNSHLVAISQVCPNNLSGTILTPLDLCEATPSSSDATLGYQGTQTNGLAISNQGAAPPVLPTSGANTMLQGSSAMVLDNSLPSPSSAVTTSSRDVQRYAGQRPPASLPNNENQKMSQYNQMLPGKNNQHSAVSTPGSSLPTDRGVRLLPGGNGVGAMSGVNRGMSIARPAYQQGVGQQNMVSSGNTILSSSGAGMPNIPNGQGNTMMRPREALHMMRAAAPEEQRQMTMQELQMQGNTNSQGGIPAAFNGGLSTGYPNQSASSSSAPVQTYHQMGQQQPSSHGMLNNPHHSHMQGGSNNPHPTTPQQQAYLLRLAKERQLQQRMLHQQQHNQQFNTSSNAAAMSHVQPPQQHPAVSSPNAQHHHHPSSPMTSQSQQKQQHNLGLPHGLVRNTPQTIGVPNQVLKQRQRQQQQPGGAGRQQQQQRQLQQAKHLKGMGRGNNMMMHQNIDTSHVNGLSIPPVVADSLYSGPPGKSLVPPPQGSSHQQQKLFSRSPPPQPQPPVQSSKQHLPSYSDNQGSLTSQQPLAMSPSQQPPPLVRQASSGLLQQQQNRGNRKVSSDPCVEQPTSFHITSTSSAVPEPPTSISSPSMPSTSGSDQRQQSSGGTSMPPVQSQWQQPPPQMQQPPPSPQHQPPPQGGGSLYTSGNTPANSGTT
ncbi:hypothetical protein ACHQM5_024563 [Ranunculus cassubicifolius]